MGRQEQGLRREAPTFVWTLLRHLTFVHGAAYIAIQSLKSLLPICFINKSSCPLKSGESHNALTRHIRVCTLASTTQNWRLALSNADSVFPNILAIVFRAALRTPTPALSHATKTKILVTQITSTFGRSYGFLMHQSSIKQGWSHHFSLQNGWKSVYEAQLLLCLFHEREVTNNEIKHTEPSVEWPIMTMSNLENLD